MSEISSGNDDGIDVGGTSEVSSSSVETSSSENESDAIGSSEVEANQGAFNSASEFGSHETAGAKGAEILSTGNEISIQSSETTRGLNQMLETPENLEQAQKSVENYHHQSIAQILEANGKYMSEADRERVAQGVDSIKAVEHNPARGCTGFYLYLNGKSSMEVSAINQQQMERSTKHETNHFSSKNREIIVPQPEKNGYTVYQTVGTRQASWFHSNETGKDSDFSSKGRGLNEGLTTMYTNQQLMELSKEKGEAAERQGVYVHATELCNQLENIVGRDTLKEAYYGGNLQGVEAKVDSLAGEKSFETLRDCLDRTLSRDYVERIAAMKEAQTILAKMYERKGEKV